MPERDVAPQPNQPIDDAAPQRARPLPPPDLRPQPRRESPDTSQPDIRQTAAPMPHQQVDVSSPRRVSPEPREAVTPESRPRPQQSQSIEPLVPLRPREGEPVMTPAESPPAPQRIVTVMPREEAAPRIPEPTPPPVIVERVQPAEPIVRQTPVIRQESSTPSVDVHIGTIDLQFAPPAPPPASAAPRRRAHGFESFRRRRDYGGWED
jgi:hypothetical protein